LKSAIRLLIVSRGGSALGGVQVWVNYLAASCALHGWDVDVLLASGRENDFVSYKIAYPSLPLQPAFSVTGSREGRVRVLERQIIKSAPDVVLVVNVIDALLAVRRLKRVGNSFHCFLAVHGVSASVESDVISYRDVIDAVFCVNRLSLELLRQAGGVSAERLIYSPCGVHLPPMFSSADRDCTETLRLCWLGRIERYEKGLDDLLGILAAFDASCIPYTLKIAGAGPDAEWLSSALDRRVRAGQVYLFGALPQERVAPEVLECSDVLLMTSPCETGPMVVWEAMASGVVVFSRRYIGSGIESALLDGVNCLLYSRGDFLTSVGRLKSIMSSADQSSRIRLRARLLVEERYTRRVSSDRWSRW
jgi:glycosyltransferase involved in cell wall biosynthesis